MYLRRAEFRGHGVSINWRCSEPLHDLAYGTKPAFLSPRLVPGETLAQTGKDLTALPDKGLWLQHAALQLLQVQNHTAFQMSVPTGNGYMLCCCTEPHCLEWSLCCNLIAVTLFMLHCLVKSFAARTCCTCLCTGLPAHEVLFFADHA